MKKGIIITVTIVILLGLLLPVLDLTNGGIDGPQENDLAQLAQELPAGKIINAPCTLDSPFKKEWPTTMCESFEGESLMPESVSDGTILLIQDGAYVIDNRISENRPAGGGYTIPIVLGAANDALISINGEMECLEGDCGWGIFLRSTFEEINYVFLIDNQGQFSLTGFGGDGVTSQLGNIQSGVHETISVSEENTISAIMEGEQMMFFVNNNLLASHRAGSGEDPVFGLVAWGSSGAKAKNLIDDILVRSQ